MELKHGTPCIMTPILTALILFYIIAEHCKNKDHRHYLSKSIGSKVFRAFRAEAFREEV